MDKRRVLASLGFVCVILGVAIGLNCLFRLYFTDEFMPPMLTPGPMPAAFASKLFSLNMACPKEEWATGQSAAIQVYISNLQNTTLTFTLQLTVSSLSEPIILKATLPAQQSAAIASPEISPSTIDTYATVYLTTDYQDASGNAIVEKVPRQESGCQVKLASVMARKTQQLSLTGVFGLTCVILGMVLYYYANNPLKRWRTRIEAVFVALLLILFEAIVLSSIFIAVSNGGATYGT